ncbi:PepSY domain-containing protein [Fredinandcohnia humi]
MKRNVLIIGIAGVVLLGGAVGVSAISDEIKTETAVSFEKAKEIATKAVDGTFVEGIELEREHGELIYDVDLEYEGNVDDDAEVKIDSATGEIRKVDDDRNDDNNAITSNTAQGKVESSAKITSQEAIAIATKDTAGIVVEIEYDDDGYYEIEMNHSGSDVEMKVSATDGSILKKEIDDEDNDD